MKYYSGFTLVELLIAIAIVAILVAAATPSYQNYLRKARFTEIVQYITPYKTSVEICYYTTGEMNHCRLGNYGIPEMQKSELIQTLTIERGHIKVVPNEIYGLKKTDTYELQPDNKALENSIIKWNVQGGAVVKGYVTQY